METITPSLTSHRAAATSAQLPPPRLRHPKTAAATIIT